MWKCKQISKKEDSHTLMFPSTKRSALQLYITVTKLPSLLPIFVVSFY